MEYVHEHVLLAGNSLTAANSDEEVASPTSILAKISVQTISRQTGIQPTDIGDTLQALNMLTQKSGKPAIIVDCGLVDAHIRKVKAAVAAGRKRLDADGTKLQWTPTLSKGLIAEEEMQAERELKEVALSISALTEEKRTGVIVGGAANNSAVKLLAGKKTHEARLVKKAIKTLQSKSNHMRKMIETMEEEKEEEKEDEKTIDNVKEIAAMDKLTNESLTNEKRRRVENEKENVENEGNSSLKKGSRRKEKDVDQNNLDKLNPPSSSSASPPFPPPTRTRSVDPRIDQPKDSMLVTIESCRDQDSDPLTNFLEDEEDAKTNLEHQEETKTKLDKLVNVESLPPIGLTIRSSRREKLVEERSNATKSADDLPVLTSTDAEDLGPPEVDHYRSEVDDYDDDNDGRSSSGATSSRCTRGDFAEDDRLGVRGGEIGNERGDDEERDSGNISDSDPPFLSAQVYDDDLPGRGRCDDDDLDDMEPPDLPPELPQMVNLDDDGKVVDEEEMRRRRRRKSFGEDDDEDVEFLEPPSLDIQGPHDHQAELLPPPPSLGHIISSKKKTENKGELRRGNERVHPASSLTRSESVSSNGGPPILINTCMAMHQSYEGNASSRCLVKLNEAGPPTLESPNESFSSFPPSLYSNPGSMDDECAAAARSICPPSPHPPQLFSPVSPPLLPATSSVRSACPPSPHPPQLSSPLSSPLPQSSPLPPVISPATVSSPPASFGPPTLAPHISPRSLTFNSSSVSMPLLPLSAVTHPPSDGNVDSRLNITKHGTFTSTSLSIPSVIDNGISTSIPSTSSPQSSAPEAFTTMPLLVSSTISATSSSNLCQSSSSNRSTVLLSGTTSLMASLTPSLSSPAQPSSPPSMIPSTNVSSLANFPASHNSNDVSSTQMDVKQSSSKRVAAGKLKGKTKNSSTLDISAGTVGETTSTKIVSTSSSKLKLSDKIVATSVSSEGTNVRKSSKMSNIMSAKTSSPSSTLPTSALSVVTSLAAPPPGSYSFSPLLANSSREPPIMSAFEDAPLKTTSTPPLTVPLVTPISSATSLSSLSSSIPPTTGLQIFSPASTNHTLPHLFSSASDPGQSFSSTHPSLPSKLGTKSSYSFKIL